MPEIGSFFANYRVLALISSHPTILLYAAERAYNRATVLLLYCFAVTVETDEERDRFLNAISTRRIQHNGQSIEIQGAGVVDRHPYVATAYSEEILQVVQEHVARIDQALGSAHNDSFGRFNHLNVFISSFAPSAEYYGSELAVPTNQPAVASNESATIASFNQQATESSWSAPIPPIGQPQSSWSSTPPPINQSGGNWGATPPPIGQSGNNWNATPPPPIGQPDSNWNATPPISQSGSGWNPTPPVSQAQNSWSAPMPPVNGSMGTGQQKSRRKPMSGRARVLAGISIVLCVALLAWFGSYLYTVIPAATATVNVIPVKKALTKSYNLVIVTGNPVTQLEVQGRQVQYTTPQRSQTIVATGQGTDPAKSARGTVVLSQINLTSPSPNGNDLGISSISDGRGFTITTDEVVPISTGATVRIPAHVTPAGSAGNVGANDINGPIEIVDHITQARIGTGYLSNPAPFSGGTDARGYIYVKQSDIDAPTKAMVTQLTTQAKAEVQKQIHKDERTTQNIQCTPNTSSDHRANDRVGNATVKVSVTCNALLYTDQALHDTAVKDYQTDGTTQFGNGYGLVGDMIISQPTTSGGMFFIKIDGIWSFQYTPAHLQDIQRLIAGHSKADALRLLQARRDMQKVTLVTAGGIGTAVPTDLKNIKLNVASVDGLHAQA
jgi:VCBS repeat-containing protein